MTFPKKPLFFELLTEPDIGADAANVRKVRTADRTQSWCCTPHERQVRWLCTVSQRVTETSRGNQR